MAVSFCIKRTVFFVGCLLCAGVALAGPTDVPRILLVGDSWPGFMHIFRSFDQTLGERPGFEAFGQRGGRTTEVGIRASEFNTPHYLNLVAEELAAYPTIDIVHLSLGGNDFIMDSNWTPAMSQATLDAFIDQVNAHTQAVIDFVLAIRPNIRIGLCGYTYGDHQMGNATPLEMNTAWAYFESTRLALAQTNPRVFYIHNLGLTQYHYGIPNATPPIPAAPAEGHVPYPGGYADNYVPFPGGNPNYNAPLEALMDDDLHLTMQGYDILARRCLDEFYQQWLTWPAVVEVNLVPAGKAPVATFSVTFSESVTGVDASDFAVSPSGSVTGVSGTGAVYTVTVDMAGSADIPQLAVLDDDTIIDSASNPLGGPGAGNGGFEANGPVRYADDPIPTPASFDEALLSVDYAFLPAAWMLGGESFDPNGCDVNGGSISIDPPDIVGNGMLDSCELALVTACLANPAIDLSLTGGIPQGQVQAAWTHNYAQMLSDLGGPTGRLSTTLAGLDTLLAGLMTLGDAASTSVPMLLMTAVGVVIELPPDVVTPNAASYQTLGEYLGPNGDADGDGYTNREEYEYFMALGGRDFYVRGALDPAMAPELRCNNSAGGTFESGDTLCLAVPDPVDLTGEFEWLKDGVPMTNTSHIAGTGWRELRIVKLTVEDSGVYECSYNDGTRMFGPIEVTVNPPQVPVAAAPGLALLAAGLLAAAAARLRRK